MITIVLFKANLNILTLRKKKMLLVYSHTLLFFLNVKKGEWKKNYTIELVVFVGGGREL